MTGLTAIAGNPVAWLPLRPGAGGALAGTFAPPAANALTTWQFAPMVSAGLIAAAAGYLVCARRVRRRHPARPWPARRSLPFFLALAVIAVATQSSAGAYDDVLFTDHMVQHLLLIMVAPPLLVAGRPVTLLLHASRNPLHRWVKRAVRSRAATALTWPPAAVALYCAVVAGTHLTPLANLVLENGAVHNLEHALYLVTGYLYFLPVIGSEPIRRRISVLARYTLLAATMPADIAVGIVLTMVPRAIFPAYAHVGRNWGPSLVTDLHDGGWIMFIGSDIVMTFLAVAMAVRFVAGSRRTDRTIGSVERLRSAAMLREIAAAGVTVPPAPAAGRTVDDPAHHGGSRDNGGRDGGGRDGGAHDDGSQDGGAHDDGTYLDAYNAYLAALGGPAKRATDGSATG